MNPPITCHVNETLDVAVQRMLDHGVHALTVLRSDGSPTGLLDERDVCIAALQLHRPIEEILVNSAMSEHVSPPPALGDRDLA